MRRLPVNCTILTQQGKFLRTFYYCSDIIYVFLHLPVCSSDMLIDSMVASGQLKEELRDKVREAMLKKHHHQNERKLSNRIPLVRSIADIGKKHSEPLLLERNGEILQRTHISFSSVFSTTGELKKKKKSIVEIP